MDVEGAINPATVDLDPAAPGIQFSLTTRTGTPSVDNAGVVTYYPVRNFTGIVSISYTVEDNDGAGFPAATITVTVSPVNDAPVAVDDIVPTNEDTHPDGKSHAMMWMWMGMP